MYLCSDIHHDASGVRRHTHTSQMQHAGLLQPYLASPVSETRVWRQISCPATFLHALVNPDHQSTLSDRDNTSVCSSESAGNTHRQDTFIVVQRRCVEIARQNAVTFMPEGLSPPASAAGVKEKASSHGVAKGTCGVQEQRHLAFQQGSRSESTCTAA